MRFELEFPVFTVKKILSLYENNSLNLDPGFQRESVWEDKNRALLVDSILQSVPLPSILLWHQKIGNKNIYHVVDGKQRIETLVAFTKSRSPFSYSPSLVKKYHKNKEWSEIYDDLDEDVSYKAIAANNPALRKHFDNFSIPTVVVRNAGSLEDIRELFVRVNSTGMKLTGAEIRRARFLNSDLLFEAERVSSLKNVREFFVKNRVFTESNFRRMKVVEFITELMLSIKINDVLDKKISIDKMMEADISQTESRRLGKQVVSMIEYVNRYISDDYGRLQSTRFRNTADLYALIFCLWKMKSHFGSVLNEVSRADSAFSILADLHKQLRSYAITHKKGEGSKRLSDVSLRYYTTIVSGTDSGQNRAIRVSILKELLEPLFVKKDAERLFSRSLKELLWHSSIDKKCQLCGERIDSYDLLEIDHRFAHAKGGMTDIANAQLAHRRCNRSKGAK